jgi:hypothetical protein
MQTRLLAKDEYLATFLKPSENVTLTATDVIDIWPYVTAVPRDERWGHAVVPQTIEAVYRRGDAQFDHVLVTTTTSNVFLVVVVDLREDRIFGHILLDLNEEYGLLTPQ